MKNNQKPLVVIVGPTASGKTALALEIARQYDGEIICADSRTIYKGMDIGTAKPTTEEMAGVKHWGLDLVEPGQRFTAYEFKRYAVEKIDQIRSRGKMPIMVGGTGLYINSVVFDYQFDEIDESTHRQQQIARQELEKLSVEELQLKLINQRLPLPTNAKNKRHLIQAILRQGREMKSSPHPIANCYIAGLDLENEVIKRRISQRIEQMFNQGLVEEAKKIAIQYGWDNEAMTGNIYPVVRSLIDNELNLEQAIEQASRIDWQLVRRQRTWFKRNQYINWFSPENAYENLVQILDTSTQA